MIGKIHRGAKAAHVPNVSPHCLKLGWKRSWIEKKAACLRLGLLHLSRRTLVGHDVRLLSPRRKIIRWWHSVNLPLDVYQTTEAKNRMQSPSVPLQSIPPQTSHHPSSFQSAQGPGGSSTSPIPSANVSLKDRDKEPWR